MSDDEKTASKRFLERTHFLQWVGVVIEEESDGSCLLRVPHREELTNPGSEAIHGGIIATMIDNAAGTAIRTVLEDPEMAQYATTELNLSYLRPAIGDLRIEGTVRRRGSSLAVVEVDVESEFEPGVWKAVAVGRATYYVEESED